MLIRETDFIHFLMNRPPSAGYFSVMCIQTSSNNRSRNLNKRSVSRRLPRSWTNRGLDKYYYLSAFSRKITVEDGFLSILRIFACQGAPTLRTTRGNGVECQGNTQCTVVLLLYLSCEQHPDIVQFTRTWNRWNIFAFNHVVCSRQIRDFLLRNWLIIYRMTMIV